MKRMDSEPAVVRLGSLTINILQQKGGENE